MAGSAAGAVDMLRQTMRRVAKNRWHAVFYWTIETAVPTETALASIAFFGYVAVAEPLYGSRT